jgi:hypothetical protein
MQLARDWSHIVYYPMDDRDYLIFYNFQTGKVQVAILEPSGWLNFFGEIQGSPGWSHITRCKDLLFFYNEVTGQMAVRWLSESRQFVPVGIEGDGWSYVSTYKMGPGSGWRIFIGAADCIFCMATDGRWQAGGISRREWRAGRSLQVELVSWQPGKDPASFNDFPVACAVGRDETLCLYFAEPRVSARLCINVLNWSGYLGHTADWELGRGGIDSEWTHLVANNAQLLGYSANTGDAAFTRFPDRGFYWSYDRRMAAEFKPLRYMRSGWTEIVSVGWRLLFYASYSGEAALGFLSPLDGAYSELSLF